MRYIVIPGPLDGLGVAADGKPAPYLFESFLLQFVWTHAHWRESNERVESLLALSAKFKGAAPGAVVEVLDRDWEAIERIARAAHEAFTVAVLLQLMQFVHVITSAKGHA